MPKKTSAKTQALPQRNERSFGYRSISFLSCSDPKGVAESGTFRKPRNDSKKPVHKSEMTTVSSSYEQEELSFSSRKALDLQESLILLQKLQKASNYMIMLEKEQKKLDNEKCKAIDNHTRSRDPNKSKRMTRETLTRQDMLLKTEDDAVISFKPGSLSDVATTSSSQSSLCSSNDFSSSDQSMKWMERRPPSLIARLMGLEDMPTEKKIHQQSGVGRRNSYREFDSEPSAIVLMRSLRSHVIGEEEDLTAKEKAKINFTKIADSEVNKRTSANRVQKKDSTGKKRNNSGCRNRKIRHDFEGISGKPRHPGSKLNQEQAESSNMGEFSNASSSENHSRSELDLIEIDNMWLPIEEEVWSLGWRNGLLQGETDKVVIEIERVLLGDLLECLLIEFI